MIRCCEHNPCPHRPKHFLGRFYDRPWICAQCGAWWTTRWTQVWDSGLWSWNKIQPSSWEEPPEPPEASIPKRKRWFR